MSDRGAQNFVTACVLTNLETQSTNFSPMNVPFRKYAFGILSGLYLISSTLFSQNNTSAKWHFGNNAALDFMTSPPTPMIGSQLSTFEGCSGISDAAGNLLFYTDGITVWNSANTIMTGGTGLDGNSSSTQAAVVVKQPGNGNIYYIFTLDCCNSATGVKYSVVDMSLSGGLGSVITLNVPLAAQSSERLTSVKHCNGVDTWVLSQDVNGDFRSHLVTATGVSTTFTTSSVPGNSGTGPAYVGYMKFSPNGRKMGLAAANTATLGFELYDFDASTGIVSNRVFLQTGNAAYGVEFSPDGTKMYGALWGGSTLYQWDLCAGTGTAIAASVVTVATNSGGALQLATDGKIYMTRSGFSVMGQINSPNVAGIGMGYTDTGASLGGATNTFGLPNFITSGLKAPPPPFTSTVSCLTASFTAPQVYQNYTVNGCAASGYSLAGISWNFGDPSTGALNTSTLTNPVHSYSGIGTFTANLILYFSCGGGSDTVKQVVNITQPCVNVVTNGVSCATMGSASVTATFGTGPYNYYWLPSGPSSSVLSNVYAGTYTVVVNDIASFTSFTIPVTITSNVAYNATVSATPSLACFGNNTGTASIQVSGGTGSQNYYWYNGVNTVTTPSLNSLGAGNYTVTVVDAVSSCSVTRTFSLTQPPNGSITAVSSAQTLCVNSPVTFTATRSGGLPGYTYTWTGGPNTNTWTTTQAIGGLYTYTISSRDTNNCLKMTTLQVNFVNMPFPLISANYTALCVGYNLSMTGTGGTGYTWAGPASYTAAGATATRANVALTAGGIYTLTVTQGPCTATVTQSITVNPLPTPGISSPVVCELHNLQLTGIPGGGTTYTWSGPSNYTSQQLSPILPLVAMANDGIYTLAVTNTNGCVGVTTNSVGILRRPLVQAGGNTVCFGTPVTLVASGAISYTWSGPNNYWGYTATVSLPATSPSQLVYTAVGMAANGCTASATANVNTIPLPTPAVTVTPRVCLNDMVVLEATGGKTYEWKGPYNFSALGQTVGFVATNPGYAGNFTVIATDAIGCKGYATGLLALDPLPQGALSDNIGSHCVPFCADISFALKTSSPLTNLSWKIGTSTFSTNTFNYCFTLPGSYPVTITMTDSNGCDNSINYAIDAFAQPVANFEYYPENPIEGVDRVEFVNLSEGPGIKDWSWSFINNHGYKVQTQNASYIFDQPGLYPVALVVRNEGACADTIIKTIRVDSDFALYVPNAFTPNTDDNNELFQAKGFGIAKFSMSIYTRWGQKVFESTDINKGWDGTFKGESCKDDVYVWRVYATNEKGKEFNQSGFVTLYR